MNIMFYDFETQSLPLFDQPSGDPRQPHIVQAAAVLVDSETRKSINGINLIARPDGWTIPQETTDIHGVTDEYAREVGVGENLIVAMVLAMWQAANIRVAHNQSFDARIMRIALKRFRDDTTADQWKAGKSECTAQLSRPIMKMGPTAKMMAAGRRTNKMPKLTEAYRHFLGQEMPDAHSALGDVKGCLAVYWAIQDRGGVTKV